MLAEHLGVSTGLLPVTWYSGALRIHTPLHVPFCTRRPTLRKKTSTVATLIYHLFKMSSKNKKGNKKSAIESSSSSNVERSVSVTEQMEEVGSVIKTAKELSESVTQIIHKEASSTSSTVSSEMKSSITSNKEAGGISLDGNGVKGDSEFLNLKSSREEERNYLIRLNRRFAIVVEQNARLERENERLAKELEMSEVTRKQTIEDMLDQQRLESDNLRAQLREEKKLSGEKDKKINELEGAVGSISRERDDILAKLKNAERKTLELESLLGAERKKVASLEERVRSLEDQNSAIGGKLVETEQIVKEQEKKLEETEVTWEKEKQELVRQKQITETDSIQRKVKYEENLKKVDSDRAKEYENKLSQMVDLLRKEMERRLIELREALEGLREAEVGETTRKWSSELARVKEEMTLRIESLEEEKRFMEQMVEQVKRERVEEKKRFEKVLEERKSEMDEITREKGAMLDKWKHLLETKMSFQSELDVYDVLLTHEETRISRTDMNNNAR